MSLTSWFTDYVYIPLGGNRCKLWRWMLNIMIVFLLSGLWHGAALTFIVWGGIHGVYQIVGKLKNMLVRKLVAKGKIKLPQDNVFTVFVKRAVTFTLVCFAWIFFRANSLGDCGTLIAKLFTDWSGCKAALDAIGFDVRAFLTVLFMILLLVLCRHVTAPQNTDVGSWCKTSVAHSIVYVYLVMAIVVAWLALVSGGGASSFIYFQF